MSEESLYKWYNKKREIENNYVKYQIISFVIVLFAELVITVYLKQYCNISPQEQWLPAGMLFLALCLNLIMMFLTYDANPEYVDEEKR